MDVRGNKQERDLSYAQISSLNSVHGRTLFNRLFSKDLRQKLFRTATDGGDSTQQQVFREKNLSLNSVHGRTLFNRLFSKALESKGYTIGNKTKLLGQPRRCCLASPPSMAVLYIQRTILNTHKYCISFIKSPLIILSL